MMVCGIDSHNDTLEACIIDDSGRKVTSAEFVNDKFGHAKLGMWLRDRDTDIVGIEGTGKYAFRLAEHLLDEGYRVHEVPPHLTASERVSVRASGKSDAIDALAIARVTQRESLPLLMVNPVARALRVVTRHRTSRVKERTARVNQLHHDFVVLQPGALRDIGALTQPQARRRARTLARRYIRNADPCHPDAVLAQIIVDTLARIDQLDREIDQLDGQIRSLLKASGSTLTQIPGCGPQTAATLIAFARDVRRFQSKHQFAAATGTSPVPASSGRTKRHRLNRGGDRTANNALWRIAFTQARMHPEARAYLERRIAEGKTRREAIRALQRHISNRVYRILQADALTT